MGRDHSLLFGLALFAGAAVPVRPAPVLASALALFVLLMGRVSGRTIGLLVLLFVVAAGRSAVELDRFEAERVLARDSIASPERCQGRGRVVASPVGRARGVSVVLEWIQLECGGRPQPTSRALLYDAPEALVRGDVVDVAAKLAPVRLFRNLDVTDPTPLAARRGVVLSGAVVRLVVVQPGSGWAAGVDRFRAHVRRRIRATFAEPVVPMARALVLGENDLSESDDEAFKKSGLAHILAVSGTHLVFAVLWLTQALRALLVRIERLAARYDVTRASSAVGVLLALVYADFAGGSGSAWRAAFMLSAGFTLRALGRQPSGTRTLTASLALGWLLDPLAVFDLSFLLSVAATAGLMYVAAPLARVCRVSGPGLFPGLARNVLASASATLACAPLLALLSGELTLVGIVANLIAGPIGELFALPLALLHTTLAAVPTLEQGAALVASGALVLVKLVALTAARATSLAVGVPEPNAWQLCLLVVVVTAALLVRRGASGVNGRALPWLVISGETPRALQPARSDAATSDPATSDPGHAPVSARAAGLLTASPLARWLPPVFLIVTGLSLIVVIEAAIRRWGTPHGRLRVTALDVDQGDATLVDLPEGSLMLVDAGGFVGGGVDPGRRVIAPVLRTRRRQRVDVLVLSHPHPDHFGGMLHIVQEFEIGEVWDTGQGEAEGAGPVYRAWLAELAQRGVPVFRPEVLCRAPRNFGSARVEVLGPCPSYQPHVGANDNSLVVKITLGARAVLLTGDAEADQEQRLIEQVGARLRADLLKVGHHGSRTSSGAAFLSWVRPTLATVSCGVRNRFGHPHPEALARLAAGGVTTMRLDRHGSVEWTTNGEAIRVRSYGGAR